MPEKPRRAEPRDLVARIGGAFSTEIGIDVRSGEDSEIFKWFLASLLFGARISARIAIRTYREFEKEGLIAPREIVAKGWRGLVQILDRGGYARYDFRTATKLLDVCQALLTRYQGKINQVQAESSDPRDLERRLEALGKGVGVTTVGIFLRELRGVWKNAQPLLSQRALESAKTLGFLPKHLDDPETALVQLAKIWRHAGGESARFSDFEAALTRAALRSARIKPPDGYARAD